VLGLSFFSVNREIGTQNVVGGLASGAENSSSFAGFVQRTQEKVRVAAVNIFFALILYYFAYLWLLFLFCRTFGRTHY